VSVNGGFVDGLPVIAGICFNSYMYIEMPGFFSRDFPIAKTLHMPERLENIFKKPRNSSKKGRRRMAKIRARNDAREARASRRIARSSRVTRRHGFMPRAQPNNNNGNNNNNNNDITPPMPPQTEQEIQNEAARLLNEIRKRELV
jgi:hypothetical protein